MTYREAAEKIEELFGYDCSKSMVRRGATHHDIPDPVRDGPFADVLTDDDAEPAQPPTFVLDRSEDTPVHPFDTDLFSPSADDGRWPPVEREETPITPRLQSDPETDSDAARPDTPDSDSGGGTGVLKPPSGADCVPSAYRVSVEDRDKSLVAPPWAARSDDVPDVYKACGCQQCDERHFLDGDGGPIDCPDPVPVTVAGARRIYRVTEGSLWADDVDGNDVSRGRQKYARLMKADSAALCHDGDRSEYRRGGTTHDGVATVLVSCRVSCTDDEGRLITPYTLVQDTKDAWAEARDEIPEDGLLAYYWTIAGTEYWATPHVHLYLWYWDPEEDLAVEDFRPIVETFCDHSAYAEWTAHVEGGDDDAPLVNGRAVRLEHEPLLVDPEALGSRVSGEDDSGTFAPFADVLDDSGDTNGDSDGDAPNRLTEGNDAQSRGAVYVGSQLPHLALLGVEYDSEAEIAAFCDVASDGRHVAHGGGMFYEFADALDAISEYESHPNVE